MRSYPRAGSEKDRVDNALASADVIIDASASVAVSRHLSDLQTTKAARVGAFFNPAGTAVVVLTEAADRSVTLHDLEAQYCRLALTAPALEAQAPLLHPGIDHACHAERGMNRPISVY
ncbi:MAG: hypothetical protein QOJ15_6009 [Bradyrhizobium sp.]|jgi:hypothetical protein|nr:hypothetical protein [Bradyrhizobium sp.]